MAVMEEHTQVNLAHTWLDDVACAEMDLAAFFVEAGKAMNDETHEVCRGCPVRRECIIHAYTHPIGGGYFGGLSPSQRRSMSLSKALDFVRRDHPDKPLPTVALAEAPSYPL